MAQTRIRDVVRWLKSPQLSQEVGTALMVLVVHGAFINVLFSELLRGGALSGGLLQFIYFIWLIIASVNVQGR